MHNPFSNMPCKFANNETVNHKQGSTWWQGLVTRSDPDPATGSYKVTVDFSKREVMKNR